MYLCIIYLRDIVGRVCALEGAHGADVCEEVESVADGEDVEEGSHDGVEDDRADVGQEVAVVQGERRVWNSVQIYS